MSGIQSAFAARKAALASRQSALHTNESPTGSPPIEDQPIAKKRRATRQLEKQRHDVEEVGQSNDVDNGNISHEPKENDRTGEASVTGPPQGTTLSNETSASNADRRERLRELAPETIDLDTGNVNEDHDKYETVTSTVSRGLSNFTRTSSNHTAGQKGELTIRLKPDETLALVGQYDIWVKKGAVVINNAVLRASSVLCRIYAPSTHALPVIRPLASPYEHSQAVEICLYSCTSRLRLLKSLSPLFKHIWNGLLVTDGDQHASPSRTFALLKTSADDAYKRSLAPLLEPYEWQLAIKDIIGQGNASTATRTMICGPKNTGKSSLMRLLVNATLSNQEAVKQKSEKEPRIFLLDLDPGQPEFSPPGDISLHEISFFNLGAPFTHPFALLESGFTTIRSHHIGAITSREDPRYYLQCALNLYEAYQETSLQGPSHLIINTCGWIQGEGLRLLCELTKACGIDNIIYTSQTGPDETMLALSEAAATQNAAFLVIPSAPNSGLQRTAAELRSMQTMSYFHLAEPEAGYLRWNTQLLSTQAPVMVPYAGKKQAIHAVQILGDAINPELLAMVLDGSVVGVVCKENTSTLPPTQRSKMTQIPYLPWQAGVSQPLDPASSRCIGQALVRSIDLKKHVFHLLMPPQITQHIIELLNPTQKSRDPPEGGLLIVLVRGKLDTPTWAYKEGLEWEKSQSRQRAKMRSPSPAEGDDDNDEMATLQQWAATQPWVDLVPLASSSANDNTAVEEEFDVMHGQKLSTAAPAKRGISGKARKVRRDLRYRPPG